jgi:hypothetical protein
MPFLELAFPPGIRANGTDRSNRGSWIDGSLVRFNPTVQPIKGWRAHTASAVTGMARALEAWKDNSGSKWLGIGTHSKLYAMSAGGTLSDITPAGFTAGRADATSGSGYGMGAYGTSTFGTPRPDTANVLPASVWNLGVFGDHLLGVMEGDGKLYRWLLNPVTQAAVIAGAPTGLTGLHVAGKAFVFALAGKRAYWSDLGDETVWTPLATNQAGDQDENTSGTLTCGRSIRGGELLFTEVDVWLAQYLAGDIVWGFERLAKGCGTISKGSPVSVDVACHWMGQNNFWTCDGGYVRALPCDVQDKVFSDFNTQQRSKVTGYHNAGYQEVVWLYPSGSSIECDSYVAYDYVQEIWTVGKMARTAGCEPGVFTYPLLAGTDGKIYEHENGFSYDGAVPFITCAPVELGSGDQMMGVSRIVADERTQGDVQVSFKTRAYPNNVETVIGPVTVSTAPTWIRFQARQVELKFEFTGDDDARLGVCRLDVSPRGRR